MCSPSCLFWGVPGTWAFEAAQCAPATCDAGVPCVLNGNQEAAPAAHMRVHGPRRMCSRPAWRRSMLMRCPTPPFRAGGPVSRYQRWAREAKLPREGGYRFLGRLHCHHRRKSDSKRESGLAVCTGLGSCRWVRLVGVRLWQPLSAPSHAPSGTQAERLVATLGLFGQLPEPRLHAACSPVQGGGAWTGTGRQAQCVAKMTSTAERTFTPTSRGRSQCWVSSGPAGCSRCGRAPRTRAAGPHALAEPASLARFHARVQRRSSRRQSHTS